MTTTKNLTGAHGIGAIVFWALRDVRVRRADMRAAFEAVGLGAAVQRDPSPAACLSRAVQAAKIGRPTVRFERVRDDAAIATEALSLVAMDASAETASYLQVGRVSVDKTTAQIATGRDSMPYMTAEDEKIADRALQAASDAYHEAREWGSTTDLGHALKQAMYGRARSLLLGAVNLRGQSGGVYYVRESKLAAVEELAAWVSLHAYGELTILRLTDDGAETVGRAARATILDRVAEVTGGLDELVEKIRTSSEDELDRVLEPTLARFDLISQQVDLYADVLGATRDDLVAKANAAKAAIMARCIA